jgi:uncharacterized membrane protein
MDHMGFLTRFTQGELRLTRLEAFSDGVFAIIVTLLVLEIKVPALKDHGNVRELAQQLLALLPKFLSWLISFIIVCKFWLNSLFLMLQSFIPFPAALMGEYATNALAVSLFGVVMAVNTLLFIALHAYILRHLIKPELVDAQEPHIIQKSFVGVLSYLIGAGGAWFSVPVAFVVYLLAKLGTRPWPTGSDTATNTIGIVRVAFWSSVNARTPPASITSGCRPTTSAAKVRARSARPALLCTSMWTLRPSLQPRLCNSSRKATGAVSKFPTTPMRRILLGCSAATTSGVKRKPISKMTMSPIVLSRMVESSRRHVRTHRG